jgi:hypothetical protein
MIELEHGDLNIALHEDADGRDQVSLNFGAGACELSLTPHQARVLATELIMAVNRAEVRNNLRTSQSHARKNVDVVGLKAAWG